MGGSYNISRFPGVRSAAAPSSSSDGRSVLFLTDITGLP